jgi:hypothetical protein
VLLAQGLSNASAGAMDIDEVRTIAIALRAGAGTTGTR